MQLPGMIGRVTTLTPVAALKYVNGSYGVFLLGLGTFKVEDTEDCLSMK